MQDGTSQDQALLLQGTVMACNQQGCVLQVMSTQTLRSHMHPLISEDHMFSAFVDGGLVTDLACFYDRQQQRFTSIIALGPRTCGYKRITHGGTKQLLAPSVTRRHGVEDARLSGDH